MLVLVIHAGILILGTIDFVLWAASVVLVLVTVTGKALDVFKIVKAGMRAFLAIVLVVVIAVEAPETEIEFIEIDMVLWGNLLGANNGVAKSDGGDVRGT